ncbi:putative disease resistance protein RGA3 [Vitis riparia]|uniref:putative disease resistance protein RGA3 n=1 Tax=Vitis riparia TaxID=96939 RepID=UPI00155ABEC8|nr:putative disease resistance protein RGA3 [Vitis riparia]XP_034679067.1 putative disease resistance protein RGA3 [Vitis riparia]XP_034679068.1 putative disease resistance protein RGA3 [Vitis riparia]XP_034679069.1 putative disease resistance protein RGA3 [Vitis riparia]XP_034679070.1 putative disease resistance protein RGA3 [Vitis riparia]
MAEQIPFSVVENVLSSLGSSVVQKIGSIYGVRRELTKLEETLGTLKAVLLDAEDHLEKSRAVKDWVKRLKGVVYDVDDLLDDFATYRLQQGGLVRQVSHFFSSSNQVAFRFQMSGRVDDIKEALDEIKKDIFLLNAIPRSTIHPRAKNIGRETHSSPHSSNLNPRSAEKEDLLKLVLSPDKKIVAIVGIGGLGKTTLAQLVYDDERVQQYFAFKKWVCVSDYSGEGFGESALLKKLSKSKNDEGSQSLSLDDLKNELHKQISQKRYLLVLDDVWNNENENWEKVRTLLEVGDEGSKIVVTTRNAEVSFMGNNTVCLKLKGLDKDESWNLFSNITFGGQTNTVNPEIIKVGREIVNMCNGVPLIINTLGRTLMQFKSDLSKWLSIQKNENLLSLPYGNDNVLQVLKLSYDNLPTHLKQCFTYCALFPKGYEIEKKLLVQLWIAQGYIQSTNGNEQLEDIGDQYFKELLSRSLLEEVKKDDFNDTLSCKMWDLIYDLAQSIVGFEILVLRSYVNNIPEEARHVSLFEEINPMIKALKGKPLRTFLNHCVDSYEDSTIVNSFFPSFMCLRALSLSRMGVEKVPKCLGKLSHLRYLDLSHNGFKVLPNAITRLKNLQTLKLIRCWNLQRISNNIGELINLRHLENNGCYHLTHMPHGIGKLTLLQSLPLFVVGNDIGWLRNHKIGSLSELKGLNQLRGGLNISNLQNVRDVELVSRGEILKGKQYLQSLRLEWNRSGQDAAYEGDKLVMEGLQPHPHLKDIFIAGYGGTEFPTWMMNEGLGSLFPHLIEIEISGCSRCEILPPFSQLPSLKSLKLHHMKEAELKEGSLTTPLFPSLESLELSDMPKLKELWRKDLLAEEGPSFSHLSKLYIHECSSLASLHSSPSLSQLEIIDCHNLASLELHSSPCLSQLEIINCHNLASLELHSSPCLSRLTIHDCPNLTSMELPSSPPLSRLEIRKCPNLASFKVAPLPSLETLSLFTVRYGVIWQIMSVSASSSSLKSLYIESIDDMISLPKELLQHVSGLVTLQICECPNLQSLELPSSHCLSKLKIINCPNLASFNVSSLPRLEELSLRGVRAEVLRQLMFVSASSSLKSLRILEIDGMISLPEEPLQYVSTLETLYIVKCSGLATLLHWMGSLSSLMELIICDCSELTSLPEEIYSLKKLQKFYF